MALETATYTGTSAPDESNRRPTATATAAGEERAPRLPRRWRHTVLAIHIAASVALLGDSAAFLTIAVRAHGAPADEAEALYDALATLSVLFGIPLSFVALGTGITLGIGTRWGVLRYPWVIAKLLLLVTVMGVGGLVLGPAENAARDGGDATVRLVSGAAWDIAALATAVALSVFKPGRALRRTRTTEGG